MLCGLVGLNGQAVAEEAWQSVPSIAARAEAHALERLGAQDDTTVESGGIDGRLRLPRCSADLDARMHGGFSGNRATVAVSCASPQQWQLFVPIRVFQMVDVAVANRTIAAGEIIGREAVRLERRPSAGLPHLFARGLDAVIGHRARQTITTGAVLQVSALNVMQAVERGALVTLTTRRAGISVEGSGEALEPGSVGARIRIRTAAGRVVEGIVLSEGKVRVGS